MGSSRRSQPAGSAASLAAAVEHGLRGVVGAGDRLLVGLSGGIDSVVLLDLLQRIARRRRFQLAALHVNHQISARAAEWARFCRRLCRERAIPLRVVRVMVERGDSLEAAARAARYAALFSERADFVVLAHHQDDQAETVLLQLLRGAGVKGLAAMPPMREAGGGRRSSCLTPRILRPLLNVPRSEIERYARRRGLKWVEDESNLDTRLARNFVRHELLPAISARFPACRATLARSARHLAEAAQLLDELAAIDTGGEGRSDVLNVGALQRLSGARAKNLLRWFLAVRGLPMPGAERLEEMLRQIVTGRDDAQVRLDLDRHTLYRWRGTLHLVRSPVLPPPRFARPWHGERELKLPELGGALRMTRRRGVGISLDKLDGKPIVVRVRAGGERFQPERERPRRTLKNLLQEGHVPPWERERLPLLYCGERLVWVPGIGVDCAWQAAPGEPSLRPSWQPVRSE